jgi:predicted DCC family thiol-disulfide oxidoreductase YuxK
MANTLSVICFDGICNLCHRSVQWVIRRDKKSIFKFASLQSHAAEVLLSGRHPAGVDGGIILVSDGQIWLKSDAWMQIVNRLNAPWCWLTAFKIFPKKFRDAVYDFIAARRYRWFGKLDACPLPDPALKSRFLD